MSAWVEPWWSFKWVNHRSPRPVRPLGKVRPVVTSSLLGLIPSPSLTVPFGTFVTALLTLVFAAAYLSPGLRPQHRFYSSEFRVADVTL